MPLTRQGYKIHPLGDGEGSAKHTPALFSYGRRAAEKLDPALWFHSLKRKTEELMLDRNIFNQFKKK